MRRSHAMKSPITTTAPASEPTMGVEDQPRVGASMMAQSNRLRPSIDSPAPTASGRWERGLLELGTSHMVATRPTTAMGTLIKNTDPHEKCERRTPARIGPRATPTCACPTRRRWRERGRAGGEDVREYRQVHGINAAAPRPWSRARSVKRSGLADQAARRSPC